MNADTLVPAIGRTVIRESAKRIEEKGLVTVAQGRGTQVAPVGSWKMPTRPCSPLLSQTTPHSARSTT